MKPMKVRLLEKSKPRVTVGRKATGRRRDGDGWAAEARQMTFSSSTSAPPAANSTVEIQVGSGGTKPS